MKKLRAFTLFMIFTASLAGCAATDVVLRFAPVSLERMVETYGVPVTEPTQGDPYYSLTADGETLLTVSGDYSLTGDEDIAIRTPLSPFTDAGLDPLRLGAGYRAEAGELIVFGGYGDGTGRANTFTEAVFESVAYDRSALGYHQALDHFGVQLPGGKFEWAKDAEANDKDIVFVLAAQPLADIGADVNNIEGWTFVTMKDEKGAEIDVLVKPYDLQ